MPTFGGSSPFPLRFGGGKTRLQSIVDSLGVARGTAYDVSQPSNVYAEDMAIARCVEALWSANARLANQWDPARMTDFLERWEAILEVPPAIGDSLRTRRQRVAGKLKAATGPTAQIVSDACAALLGSMFVQVEFTPLATAVQQWPANGFATSWYSTTCHIVVRLTQPSTVSNAQYYQAKGLCVQLLDSILPAYMTFDVAKYSSVVVSQFLLDDPANLDNETLA